LDARTIGGPPHHPAKRIDLAHNGAFRNPSDRWIAGHLPYGLEILGQEESSRTTACGKRRRLSASVPTTYDDHIVAIHLRNLWQRRVGGGETAGPGSSMQLVRAPLPSV
jgi:hypothetical protein